MTCLLKSEERTGQMLAYCAGTLGAEAAQKLEAHMKSCAECAAEGLQQSRVWKTLDSWQPAPVSADFDRRLFAQINALKAEPWWERAGNVLREFLQPLFAQPAFSVSAATLVIAAGFFLDHPVKISPFSTSPVAVRVSPVEADQVEAALEDMEMLRQFDPTADEPEGTAKSM